MISEQLIADMREQFGTFPSAQLELSPKVIKEYIANLRHDIELCKDDGEEFIDLVEDLEKDVKALQRVLSLPLEKVVDEFSAMPIWYHE